MVGHGGSSAGSYLADPTSPIHSHRASIVVTSTLRVKEGDNLRGHRMVAKGDSSQICYSLLVTHCSFPASRPSDLLVSNDKLNLFTVAERRVGKEIVDARD